MDRRERIPTLHELKLAGRVERARALFGPGGYICLDFVSCPPDEGGAATPGVPAGYTTGRTTGHHQGKEEEENESGEDGEGKQGGKHKSSNPPRDPAEVSGEGSGERRVGGDSQSASSPRPARGSMDPDGEELPTPLPPSPSVDDGHHGPTPVGRLLPGEGSPEGGHAESISVATRVDQRRETRHERFGEGSPRARTAGRGRGRGGVWTVTLKIVGGRPRNRPGFPIPNLEPRGNVRFMVKWLAERELPGSLAVRVGDVGGMKIGVMLGAGRRPSVGTIPIFWFPESTRAAVFVYPCRWLMRVDASDLITFRVCPLPAVQTPSETVAKAIALQAGLEGSDLLRGGLTHTVIRASWCPASRCRVMSTWEVRA